MPIKKLAALATLTITLGLGIFPAHAQKMYWTDSGTGKIQRSDLDGSNVEDIVTRVLAAPDRNGPRCVGW